MYIYIYIYSGYPHSPPPRSSLNAPLRRPLGPHRRILRALRRATCAGGGHQGVLRGVLGAGRVSGDVTGGIS